MGFATKSVKRTTEKSCYAVRPFSRPLHGLRFHFALIPAVNCWAIVIRPLRGLVNAFGRILTLIFPGEPADS
jgi:hypothetical protein